MSILLLVLELGQFLFIRDFTRNPEIEKTLSEFWSVSGTGVNGDTKFGLNFSNEKLLSTIKRQVYIFYSSLLLRENQQGEETPFFGLKSDSHLPKMFLLFSSMKAL